MRIIRWFFGALSILIFLIVVFSWISILRGPVIEPKSTLLLSFDGPLPEAPVIDFGVFFGDEPRSTLRSVVFSLERAAADERIAGVVLDVGRPEVGLAQLQELDRAMERFRASGKFSVAFLETAGEISRGDGAYALATLADEVILAPPGDVNLIGLRSEPMFFASALEKLGVNVHFEKRGKYKSAANQFTATAMDPPQRESLAAVVDDLQSNLVELIARRRSVAAEDVWSWIKSGPHLAPEAVQLGLVDTLAYWDEVRDQVTRRAGKEDSLVSVGTYWLEGQPHAEGTDIALVFGEGTVTRGDASSDPFSDSAMMASNPIAQAFRDLREEGTRAVIFRVDSPGGSYIASDLIRREVELTRDAGIPVVISMGNVAASGGYFVAMDADYILADSATITGSIGVFSGLFDISRALGKIGVTHDSYQTAPNADAFSQLEPIDERRKKLAAKFADRIYVDFTTKVAEKRKIELSRVLEIAQGRVWSGQDALEHGLVDGLGGLHEALDKALTLAELDADTPINLQVWPRTDPSAALRSLLRGTIRGAQSMNRVSNSLEVAHRLWEAFGVSLDDAPLLLPNRLPRLY